MWRSYGDAQRLHGWSATTSVRVCEEALAEAQRTLARAQWKLATVQSTEDTTALRRVGMEAARTASLDTLGAMAVQAAGRCVFADNGNADEETLEDLPPRERCLRTAVVNGHVEAVIALLTAGAEVDRAATDGWTALNSAASGGNVEILRALLEAGAEVKHANTGRTPLAAALANNQEAAALALVQAGATTA